MVQRLAFVFIFACIVVAPLSVSATTYTVQTTNDTISGSCSGSCSLRDAILAANSHSGSDTIVLSAGTYTLNNFTDPDNADTTGSTGDLDISDTSGTLTIDGVSSAITIIDGNATDRIFDIKDNTTVVMTDVTITNGNVTDEGLELEDPAVNYLNGGGISNFGTLTLSQSVISNNTLDSNLYDRFGAGLYCGDGTVTLTDVTLSGNYATGSGGQFVNGGGLALGDYTSSCNATITGSTITNNTFDLVNGYLFGGGLYLAQSSTTTVSVTDTTIANNTAAGEGGVYIAGTTGAQATTFNRVTINGNRSYTYGGGMYISGNVKMTNVTVYGNQASLEGGGLYFENQTYTDILLYNSTVTHNYSQVQGSTIRYGGGVYTAGTAVDLTINGSIIAGNYRGSPSGSSTADDCYEPASNNDALTYSLLGTSSNCGFTTVTGSTVNPASITNITSATFGAYGGTVDVVAISGDAVTDALAPVNCTDADSAALTVDARGYTRPEDTNCDLGAYELDQTNPVVTVTGSSATVECGSTYTDAGANATDNFELNGSVQTTNPVDTSVPNLYTVMYLASDIDGNTDTDSRAVTVQDTTVPTITLLGEANVTIDQGETYTDAGATANDSCAGSLTTSITTTGSVDTDTPGEYTLYYNVSDTADNAATTATRIVTVTDTTPVVTTNGKYVKVTVNGEVVDRKKIGRSVLDDQYSKLKTSQFYDGYTSVIVLTTRASQAKVTVLRLTERNTLTHKVSAQFAIAQRSTSSLRLKRSKHRIIAEAGGRTQSTQQRYRLTTAGELREL